MPAFFRRVRAPGERAGILWASALLFFLINGVVSDIRARAADHRALNAMAARGARSLARVPHPLAPGPGGLQLSTDARRVLAGITRGQGVDFQAIPAGVHRPQRPWTGQAALPGGRQLLARQGQAARWQRLWRASGPINLVIGLLLALSLAVNRLDRRYLERRVRDHELALRHITDDKELAETTLQSITDAVIIVDTALRIVSLNAAAIRFTGRSRRAAIGASIHRIFQLRPTTSGDGYIVDQALHHGEIIESISAILVSHAGIEYQIEQSAAPMRRPDGAVFGAVLVFHDVTDRHRLTAALLHQARHDYLTGLPNRQALADELALACRDTADGKCHALLYVDLDQLKIVNDSCGHPAGDELLRQNARLLTLHVRTTDLVARIGGDEFVTLLRDCDLAQATRISDSLLQAIRDNRFVWNARLFPQSASAGLVAINAQMNNPEAILSAADSACYLAKERGRNRVCVYRADDGSFTRYRDGMNWVNAVTEALEEKRLHLYRQGIAPAAGGPATEYEILMRLAKTDGTVASPALFIPAVERYGVMPSLDRWVIRTLVRHLRDAENAAEHPCYAVNLSGTSLNDDFFLQFVLETLTAADVSRIRFEITETAAITNFPRAREFISELRAKGCRFSLDDFGSGLSSFAYLRNLEIDTIKIDGSFVSGVLDDSMSRAIVRSINQVAHDIGLKTVAEFVESDAILSCLRELGVDFVQGSAIHPPEPMIPGIPAMLE